MLSVLAPYLYNRQNPYPTSSRRPRAKRCEFIVFENGVGAATKNITWVVFLFELNQPFVVDAVDNLWSCTKACFDQHIVPDIVHHNLLSWFPYSPAVVFVLPSRLLWATLIVRSVIVFVDKALVHALHSMSNSSSVHPGAKTILTWAPRLANAVAVCGT